MLISRVPVYVLVLIIIKDITGFEKDNPKSDDENYSDANSGSGQSTIINNDNCDDVYYNYSDCSFYHKLVDLTSNEMINLATDVLLQSIVPLSGLENISIIGHNNATVNCDNVGGIYFDHCQNCTLIGIKWEKCGNKNGSKPVIELCNSSNITIQNCYFQNSVTQSIALSEMSGNVTINGCTFAFNNYYEDHGVAIHYLSKTQQHSKLQLTISNCNFTHNGMVNSQSVVHIGPSSNKITEHIFFITSVFLNNIETPIYISHQNVLIAGNMLFKGNVANRGGGIFINNNTKVTYHRLCAKFINNNAWYGGALYLTKNSNSLFEGNLVVTFNNNTARYAGGALYIEDYSAITFEGNSIVFINNNQAVYGGAILIWNATDLTFEGNSTVTIYNNQANFGGAIYIRSKSVLKYNENSTATINNNQAKYRGGAINILYDSDVTVIGNSTVTINNNQGDYGGAINIRHNSDVTFQGNSIVFINNNQAVYGGAILIRYATNLKFEGNSKVFINNSEADYGGSIYIRDNSNVTFEGNSTVIINNNQADDGGAIKINYYSNLKFKGNSIVTINDNTATYFGGAIDILKSNATFEGNCRAIINNNQADHGGAVYIWHNSNVMFEGNSTVTINNNQAINGGALYIQRNSSAIFNGNSVVTFDNNAASADGGALHANKNCNIKVKGNSTIIFNNNQASGDGGAIYFNNQINVLLENSSTVILSSNTAENYGGAIYSTITQITKYFNINEIKYSDNRAREAGNLLYIDVPKSCNASCLTHSTVGISNNISWQSVSDRLIATSPNTLTLHYPAKCINNDDSVGCEKYYIDNIMLGQEIVIPACLLDYYNRPAEVTQFTIIGEDHQNYYVYGSQYILISCNHSIDGISIIGNKTISDLSLNYSIFFTSHISSKSTRKSIVANLTVELSPCYPGFLYNSKSQKCECYNNSGIVYCSGSSSAIKRGYWFGHVTGIPTVTFCPINYCNFTCCKTTNGYHQLSSVRKNQCRMHRAGIACGSCKNGYTLPYYSSECVSIDKCTVTWTIVIVILTVLYWVAIVAVVFIMMHYQINIGKLYAITYYYSIVDALLSYNSDDFPDGLYTFINIMYSIAKLTPQFLGKLCLVKGISGIDQQFIHYIHPLAVAFILLIVTLLARCSHRISSLLSRAIIRVICFLLLFSYTSMTTTSLLLLKYLKFSDVTKVYTYLSPDTEYFHGRHLAYGIIAIICTITVAIGLPLLLLLEPFINHKINFTRIKPILDQFQGCYKDKYRWFAAYYMICRLLIISIIIVFTSNDFTARYLLITVCAVIVLVHLMIKPYNSNILNMFDAILLLLLVLATVLLLIDFTESNLTIQVIFLFLTLPLLVVGVVCLLAYKGSIKSLFINLFHKVDDHDSNNNIDMPTRNFDITVDETMRTNATVCGMYVSIQF